MIARDAPPSLTPITHYVRAWPEQTPGFHATSVRRVPDRFLAFDTETTVDAAQRLTFGTFIAGCYVDGVAHPCVEGIFYADDLPETDPDGFRLLQEHTTAHRYDPWVESGYAGHMMTDPLLRLMSRTEFLTRYFYPLGIANPSYPDVMPAAIVGFNLPFDISRIACGVSQSRAKAGKTDVYRNGFSFELLPGRPRVRIGKLGAKGHSFEFVVDRRHAHRTGQSLQAGMFVDTSTLVFALTGPPNKGLAAACKVFNTQHGKDGTEAHGIITDSYIMYARHDARATMELYEVTSNELYKHPIGTSADKAYSSASIAKGYLKAMGITPPLIANQGWDQRLHGYAVASFYGGRSEVMVRRVPVPAVLYDFTSMYPTVNALLGFWGLLTAKQMVARDSTDAVQRLLDTITLDDVFNRKAWPNFIGYAKITPDGDVLPIRADYGESTSPTIGLNYAHGDDPMWYAIPDLVASKLLTGKAPRIEQAYRLYPRGDSKDTLLTIDVQGEPFNPGKKDLFEYLVEKRQVDRAAHKLECPVYRAKDECTCEAYGNIGFLKVWANAGSYGVFVEMNRQESGAARTEIIHGIDPDPFEVAVEKPEQAGRYCFPAIGTVITSAARLMLATLERCVTDAGGTWAFCDTDSMCIVASPTGEPVTDINDRTIPVLTYDVVSAIAARFDQLNPYDPRKVPTMLKREKGDDPNGPQVYVYAVSAKRYALFHRDDDGGIVIDKRTEHGIGAYLNPQDPEHRDEQGGRRWVDEAWRYVIELGERNASETRYWRWRDLVDLGLSGDTDAPDRSGPPVPPSWGGRLTLGRRTITTWNVYQQIEMWNEGKDYQDQVKPYGFHLVATSSPEGSQFKMGPDRFLLIAPFERDASQWSTMPWHNMYEPGGLPYTLDAEPHRFSAYNPYCDGESLPRIAHGNSYTNYLWDLESHPEYKYLGPDGTPCVRKTVGQLQRRHVVLTTPNYIGKEANLLEERQFGYAGEVGATINDYGNRTDHFTTLVPPVLVRFSNRKLATLTGLGDMVIGRALRGVAVRPYVRDQLIKIAVDAALADLDRRHNKTADRQWRDLLREWGQHQQTHIDGSNS